MFNHKAILRGSSGAVLVLLLAGGGCLSMQSATSIDGSSAAGEPYVEAYFEYPGPQEKWSGPTSFVLHVVAKDAGVALITMTPPLVVDKTSESPNIISRVPAASGEAKKQMTREEAREQLAHLSTALEGASAAFRGCMYPVRVRLVKSDGGLVEKQGCRSEMGWSRAVSETVNVFINAVVHGTSATAATVAPPVSVSWNR